MEAIALWNPAFQDIKWTIQRKSDPTQVEIRIKTINPAVATHLVPIMAVNECIEGLKLGFKIFAFFSFFLH